MSGSIGRRFAAVVASARSFPACTCGSPMVTASNVVCTSPPVRLSTTTGCPRVSDIFGARKRATVSMPPPGGKPITMRTGRCGKVCADAPAQMTRSKPIRARMAVDNSRAMRQHIRVYAGTAGHSAWFSDDLGETWVHPNSHCGLYLEARVWAIASHPALVKHVYAGTDAGVYRWDEETARWTALESPMRDVWALAIDPENPQIFAGSRPAAFFRSDDAGASWRAVEAPGIAQFSGVNRGPTRVTQIIFDPFARDTIWASVEIGGIYKSSDRGRTWQMADRGLVSADVHGLAVIAKGVLLATTNRGLHR